MTAHLFTDLEQAGIITAAQHTRALTHPQYYSLPGSANTTEQVTWLVEHDIIDDEDLERARAHVAATGPATNWRAKRLRSRPAWRCSSTT